MNAAAAVNLSVAVEMSDYDEKFYNVQMTGTLASKGHLHTLFKRKPLPAGTDPYRDYVMSWLLLF